MRTNLAQVRSRYAKGLTTGEISAHFAEICGASVSKETISRITDKVIEEMNDWAGRPLDASVADQRSSRAPSDEEDYLGGCARFMDCVRFSAPRM